MARDHARLRYSMWSDNDFLSLDEADQRLFMLVASQPELSYAGVTPFTLKRWSRLAANSSVPKLRRSLGRLTDRWYLIVDDDTEETLIRSFVRNDGLIGSGKVVFSMMDAFDAIHSDMLQAWFLIELHRLRTDPEWAGYETAWANVGRLLNPALFTAKAHALPDAHWQALQQGHPHALPDALAISTATPFDMGSRGRAPAPSPAPSPAPTPSPPPSPAQPTDDHDPCPHDDPEGPDACPICRTPLAVAGGRGRS